METEYFVGPYFPVDHLSGPYNGKRLLANQRRRVQPTEDDTIDDRKSWKAVRKCCLGTAGK